MTTERNALNEKIRTLQADLEQAKKDGDQKLKAEQKLRKDMETTCQSDIGGITYKLSKACELYACQKELLEMYAKNDPEFRASLLGDLESEFGIFKTDKNDTM